MHKAPTQSHAPLFSKPDRVSIARASVGIALLSVSVAFKLFAPLSDTNFANADKADISETVKRVDAVSIPRKTSKEEAKTFELKMNRDVPITYEGDTASNLFYGFTVGLTVYKRLVSASMAELDKPCSIPPFKTWRNFVNGNVRKVIFQNKFIAGKQKNVMAHASPGSVVTVSIPSANGHNLAGTLVHEAAHIYNHDVDIGLSNKIRLLSGYNPELRAVATEKAFNGKANYEYVRESDVKYKVLAAFEWLSTLGFLLSIISFSQMLVRGPEKSIKEIKEASQPAP